MTIKENGTEILMDNMNVCPYIGLMSDAETRYAFPSGTHACFRLTKAHRVAVEYQAKVCFTEKYRECPVYLDNSLKELPPEAKYLEEDHSIFKVIVWGLLIVVLLFGIAFGRGWIGSGQFGNLFFSSTTEANINKTKFVDMGLQTNTATITPIITATGTPVPSQASSFREEETLTPSLTIEITQPTLTPGPNLETPFGASNEYVIHYVAKGESLSTIAYTYQTTVDVLVSMNSFLGVRSVWAGDFLVVKIGEKDPEAVYPMVPVLVKNETKLSDFCKSFNITEQEIRSLNNLGDLDIVPAWRWLILPETETE